MKWLTLFFLPSILVATTILINNDARYPLTATIISSEGKSLTSSRLEPGQTYTWSDSPLGTSNTETGPFRVTFHCPNGTFYGAIYPVSDKLTIYARHATGGARTCAPSLSQPSQP